MVAVSFCLFESRVFIKNQWWVSFVGIKPVLGAPKMRTGLWFPAKSAKTSKKETRTDKNSTRTKNSQKLRKSRNSQNATGTRNSQKLKKSTEIRKMHGTRNKMRKTRISQNSSRQMQNKKKVSKKQAKSRTKAPKQKRCTNWRRDSSLRAALSNGCA